MKKTLSYFLFLFIVVSCSTKDDAPANNCNASLTLETRGISTSSVILGWNDVLESQPAIYVAEFGPEGFNPGTGTIVETQEFEYRVEGLSSGTTYSFYVKKKCGNDNFSKNVAPRNFTTLSCQAIDLVTVSSIFETTARINWFMETQATEIEYGPSGFDLGSGTKISINRTEYWYDLNNLIPSTTYDVYMRNVCGTDLSPNSEVTSFTTLDVCKKPERLRLISVGRESLRITWDRGDNSSWQVEYGPQGFAIGTGRILNTSISNPLIEAGINPSTTYEFYVRANCGSEGFSKDAGPLVATTQP